jgi:hypothetical protein
MFICTPCHKDSTCIHAEHGHMLQSSGPCEFCKRNAVCFDCKGPFDDAVKVTIDTTPPTKTIEIV